MKIMYFKDWPRKKTLKWLGFTDEKYLLGAEINVYDPSTIVVLAQYPNGHLEVAYMKNRYGKPTPKEMQRLVLDLMHKYKVDPNRVYEDGPYGFPSVIEGTTISPLKLNYKGKPLNEKDMFF